MPRAGQRIIDKRNRHTGCGLCGTDELAVRAHFAAFEFSGESGHHGAPAILHIATADLALTARIHHQKHGAILGGIEHFTKPGDRRPGAAAQRPITALRSRRASRTIRIDGAEGIQVIARDGAGHGTDARIRIERRLEALRGARAAVVIPGDDVRVWPAGPFFMPDDVSIIIHIIAHRIRIGRSDLRDVCEHIGKRVHHETACGGAKTHAGDPAAVWRHRHDALGLVKGLATEHILADASDRILRTEREAAGARADGRYRRQVAGQVAEVQIEVLRAARDRAASDAIQRCLRVSSDGGSDHRGQRGIVHLDDVGAIREAVEAVGGICAHGAAVDVSGAR